VCTQAHLDARFHDALQASRHDSRRSSCARDKIGMSDKISANHVIIIIIDDCESRITSRRSIHSRLREFAPANCGLLAMEDDIDSPKVDPHRGARKKIH